MTLKALCEAIVSALQAKAGRIGISADSIKKGEPGNLGVSPPYVFVWGIPGDPAGEVDFGGATKQGIIGISCGSKDKTTVFESIMASLEIAERCEKVLSENTDVAKHISGSPGYDFKVTKSNSAITLLAFDVNYNPTDLLPLPVVEPPADQDV